MSLPRAEQLRQRHLALRRRSRTLRVRAGMQAESLHPLFGWADRVQDAWRWLRGWPPQLTLPLAAVAGLWLARRPSRLVSLPLRALSLWRLWQRFGAARRGR
ncbi:MAG: hypothetical protein GXD23_05110 [Comamonadaceae bacterium]|jgi:hypothetical protein|uniref:YqjK-like protein n=1 Tax=Hydrogenophaga borbori TaxID=2294117 RepID=A0A372ELV2_9BURK|nr:MULTISPECIES: hypothetical protein [Hydrogenophaga]NCT96728.1 hypothetical protein [Comamonadaceae bacterium]RFP80265.1 hypothetical protein DY262_07445 [Hydrogenophaga borbori]WQB84644.1 hypothetical protein SOM08_04825 [Hydrogenophaga sp. SNF1]